MDPNKTLTTLIALCEKWQEWGELEMNPVETLDEVTDLVLDEYYRLDDSRRGFLPGLWS